jgi:hypothetical protein
MVTPEVPGGGLVGQTVLGDHADRQLLDATGVMALGPGQVGKIDGEVAIAGATVMLGVGNDQIDRAARSRVAEVVQGA